MTIFCCALIISFILGSLNIAANGLAGALVLAAVAAACNSATWLDWATTFAAVSLSVSCKIFAFVSANLACSAASDFSFDCASAAASSA